VALLLVVAAVLAALLYSGWGRIEVASEFFRDPTPHEAYTLGLSHAGLAASALGREWLDASEAALFRPMAVELPYQEEGFFPAEEPSSLGYRFPLRRGQRLVINVDLNGSEPARVFVDLFRMAPDTLRRPAQVLSGEAGTEMVYEPWRTGEYLLRVQPELLRNGRFQVTIENGPSLEFPVAGRTHRSIGSFFGDPREAGRREHHGVDVFAPRGTPVVASAEGYVTQVDTTPVGGRVIWLRDSARNTSIYYAHLHEILVEDDARVSRGDTIGLVGNTGNARTTPPHLHFGLYARRRGPVDPWDFLFELPSEIEPVDVELAELGDWVRITGDDIHLRDRPSRRGQVLAGLPRHTAIRVLGGVGTWYRVELPDGTGGFVAGRLTEGIDDPLRSERVEENGVVRAEPLPEAPIMAEIPDGAEVSVLGTFGDFLLVRPPNGRTGWLAAMSEQN